MKRNGIGFLWAIMLFIGVMIRPSYADERLTVDLDSHLIEVNTGFTGSDLLLFGTILAEGEIIITITGPNQSIEVARKQDFGLIWTKSQSVIYDNVASFYAYGVTSPRVLGHIQPLLKQYHIGIENIFVPTIPALDSKTQREFSNALRRIKIKSGSYQPTPAIIERRGNNLFRLKIRFPADVPVGTYQLETLLVADQKIISAQTTPLFVSKVGFNSFIYAAAYQSPLLFGIAAISLAVLIGLLANFVMKALIRKFLT